MVDWPLPFFSSTLFRHGRGFTRLKTSDDHDDSSPSRPGSKVNTARLSLLALLYATFTSIIMCLVLWLWPAACTACSAAPRALLQTPVPEFPLQIRVFDKNTTFSDPPTPENNAAWNNLLPSGRGFIFVNDSRAYGLAPGIDTPRGPIYSVAMYHQMHCLGLLRRNYWRLVMGIAQTEEKDDGLPEFAAAEIKASHAAHCFDYLRQSIACAADMALEWPKDEGSKQVDGVGVPHVCASERAVRDFMEQNQFDAAKNHDIAA